MKNIENYYEGLFSNYFIPMENNSNFNPEGHTFKLSSTLGEGFIGYMQKRIYMTLRFMTFTFMMTFLWNLSCPAVLA